MICMLKCNRRSEAQALPVPARPCSSPSHAISPPPSRLLAAGDGYSTRAEDAILHGCLPVVIMDGVHASLETAVDWDRFSVRIKESMLQHLPEVLASIPAERVERMQRYLARVWHRFAYSSHPHLRRLIDQHQDAASSHLLIQQLQQRAQRSASRVPGPGKPAAAAGGDGDEGPATFEALRAEHAFPHERDAVATIIQWLYSRIADTRPAASKAA